MLRTAGIILCFLILTVSCAEHPFDFVEDAFYDVVNWKADPCDDFYRHACPQGEYGLLTTVDFRDLIDDVKYQRIGENWKNALIRSDYETFKKRVKRITSKYGLISLFTKSFSSICESNEKSIPSVVSNMGIVLSRVLNDDSIRSHIENEIYECKIEDEDFERIITQYSDGFQRLDGECYAALSQFDDNGADIFGLQLAYDLLEKDMSQQMKHTVIGLGKFGVTNEQLFSMLMLLDSAVEKNLPWT
ncbi:unnamed protein product [Caenorhabditis nigoni]